MALSCAPARPVYCAEGMVRCELVRRAIDEINVVVPGLQVYEGEISWTNITIWEQSTLRATIWADIPRDTANAAGIPAGVLGLTLPKIRAVDACLEFVAVGLFWTPGELTPDEEYQTVLHEMLHSLGAAHADPLARWSTVMRPALVSERRNGLSIADRAWLRAVYGR